MSKTKQKEQKQPQFPVVKVKSLQSNCCPICGADMKNIKSVDHVVPKSVLCAKSPTKMTQWMCKHCNSLKSNLPPTVHLYKTLRIARKIEMLVPGFHCVSICSNRNVDEVLTVHYKNGINLIYDSTTGSFEFKCKDKNSNKILQSNKELLKYLCLHFND